MNVWVKGYIFLIGVKIDIIQIVIQIILLSLNVTLVLSLLDASANLHQTSFPVTNVFNAVLKQTLHIILEVKITSTTIKIT